MVKCNQKCYTMTLLLTKIVSRCCIVTSADIIMLLSHTKKALMIMGLTVILLNGCIMLKTVISYIMLYALISSRNDTLPGISRKFSVKQATRFLRPWYHPETTSIPDLQFCVIFYEIYAKLCRYSRMMNSGKSQNTETSFLKFQILLLMRLLLSMALLITLNEATMKLITTRNNFRFFCN